MDKQKFNYLLHGGLYTPFVASLLFGSSIFSSGTSHALFSLSMFIAGSNAGHHMFGKRSVLAEKFGVWNVPVTDRMNFFDIGFEMNMTSYFMVDRIENLDAFATKIRDHFMQFERCRSEIIAIGNHVFFQKVEAENMVEILDEMTEEEGLKFMEV